MAHGDGDDDDGDGANEHTFLPIYTMQHNVFPARILSNHDVPHDSNVFG